MKKKLSFDYVVKLGYSGFYHTKIKGISGVVYVLCGRLTVEQKEYINTFPYGCNTFPYGCNTFPYGCNTLYILYTLYDLRKITAYKKNWGTFFSRYSIDPKSGKINKIIC